MSFLTVFTIIIDICILSSNAYAIGDESRFHFCRLRYEGNFNPYPSAPKALLSYLKMRTSVEPSPEENYITLDDPVLFEFPFLYLTGTNELPPFTLSQVENIRRYIKAGGILLIDDAQGIKGHGFHGSVIELMKETFPRKDFKMLSTDHTIYRSFFLLKRADGGRRLVSPHLEGITIGKRTAVIYCFNDLGGAWARDEWGDFRYRCYPNGEQQRETAFRLGVNIILYSLTLDYKQDLIHLPFILKRQR